MDLLQKTLVLPGDTSLFNVRMDEDREYVLIKIDSKDFQEVQEGCRAPEQAFLSR